ncbi:hypothetical protein FRC18_000511, partial [Serendipita sp. 400]
MNSDQLPRSSQIQQALNRLFSEESKAGSRMSVSVHYTHVVPALIVHAKSPSGSGSAYLIRFVPTPSE